MGQLALVAVGALGGAEWGEEVVAAALGGALLGVAAFRIRHCKRIQLADVEAVLDQAGLESKIELDRFPFQVSNSNQHGDITGDGKYGRKASFQSRSCKLGSRYPSLLRIIQKPRWDLKITAEFPEGAIQIEQFEKVAEA
jgi:hypothetical protein